MDWYVIGDLAGTVLACAGGLVLAVPTFRDNVDRAIQHGIDAWMAKANTKEREALKGAKQVVDRAGPMNWSKDRLLLKIGIVLIIVGLLLSIPVKVRDAIRADASYQGPKVTLLAPTNIDKQVT